MHLALSYQLRKRGTNKFNDLLQVKKNVCKEVPTKDASCLVQVQRPSYSSICYPELGYSRNETGFFSKANKNISLYLTAETEHWSKILTFCSYLWTLLAEIGIGCLSVSQTFW